jgi:alpha-beta hydrolase superfamily lysophospholipase
MTARLHIHESMWSTPDRQKLYTRGWVPLQESVRAALVLVHGLGEHCARYDAVAAFFAGQGIATFGFEHRGHGRSSGKRGHIPSYDLVLQDMDHFIEEARLAFEDVPVFLYGHSMGGNMVLYYALQRRSQALRGVISTSPGLAVGTPLPLALRAVARLLYALAPSFTLPNGLNLAHLSHDERVIEAYRNDPLVTPMVSARLGLEMMDKGRWILEHAEDFPLPLLLLQGGAERIVSPEAVREFARRVPADRITYREWEHLYHELHNEPEKDQVLHTMLDWLNRHISS